MQSQQTCGILLFAVFDSSSKFPTGVLYGNGYDFGNFDECVGVKFPGRNVTEDDNKEFTFKGQYCLITIPLPDSNKTKHTRSVRNFDISIKIKMVKIKMVTKCIFKQNILGNCILCSF